MTNITLTLPDDLAEQAEFAGLLTPEAIEKLLREAMQKSQVDHIFRAGTRVEPEIDVEIDIGAGPAEGSPPR